MKKRRKERRDSLIRSAARFAREYSDGLKADDVRRLFHREAATAWDVITEPHLGGQKVRGPFHRAKVLFLGLSYRLAPARRLLFAASALFLALGLFDHHIRVGKGPVYVDVAGFWFVMAYAALLFLLTVELVDRIRVRDELDVARALQRAILPETLPELAGYRFAHSWRTAREVGGDYLATIPLADGRVALAMGDASGHGMGAGLLMAIADSSLRTALEIDPAPQAVAGVVDRALSRLGGNRAFLTLFYGLLEPETGRLEYVCAGHPFPLLRRASGKIEELGEGSLPLGRRRRPELPLGATRLEPGDVLVIVTDGLPEATREGSDEAFGYGRIARELTTAGTAQELHDRLLAALEQHTAGGEVHDDVSVLVVERM